ncbi:30911_t:CDS:2, partial [Racocetra persica]
MHYYLAAIAFVIYVLYKCYIYPVYLSPLRKIPGPPAENFILGHYTSSLNKDLAKGLAHLVKQYGVMVRYHGLFNEPYIVIADQRLVQQIMLGHSYEYPRAVFNKDMLKEVIGEGIIFAEGGAHKRQRKMMSPSFGFSHVKEMAPTFVQAGHKLKDLWMKQIDNKKVERITITDLIPKIALDVIGRVGFNHEFNCTGSQSELAQAYNTITSQNDSVLYLTLNNIIPIRKSPTSYNNERYDSIKIINNTSERLVAEQKNSPVMTLLFAGHETTSTALSWILYFLAENPDTQDRLRKEVLDLFADRNHHPTYDEIEHLKYSECVIKETLRIMPPAPQLLRRTSKDEVMNGYFIPKGTQLWISIYSLHHDPSIWGDDVEHFNPSRWLDPEKSKITNSNYLPFGAGPKTCLGMKMALLELRSILSVIIRNFEFKLVEDFTFQSKSFGIAKPIPGIDLLVSK